MIVIAGILYIYSSVKIEAVFNTLKDSVMSADCTPGSINNGEIINQDAFQLYALKVTAGVM